MSHIDHHDRLATSFAAPLLGSKVSQDDDNVRATLYLTS